MLSDVISGIIIVMAVLLIIAIMGFIIFGLVYLIAIGNWIASLGIFILIAGFIVGLIISEE